VEITDVIPLVVEKNRNGSNMQSVEEKVTPIPHKSSNTKTGGRQHEGGWNSYETTPDTKFLLQ
jgi:hypothetical protein